MISSEIFHSRQFRHRESPSKISRVSSDTYLIGARNLSDESTKPGDYAMEFVRIATVSNCETTTINTTGASTELCTKRSAYAFELVHHHSRNRAWT
jgi:hypothetical protein